MDPAFERDQSESAAHYGWSPTVLLGTAHGRLAPPRHVDYAETPRVHADLLLTVARVMGSPREDFGDPTVDTIPLVEILAP